MSPAPLRNALATVSLVLFKLMRKLRLNSAVELALLAVELGLVQRPQMPSRSAMAFESGVPG